MSNSVSSRTLVYGRVGFATEEAKTAAEAIQMAKLDYEVGLAPVYTQRDNGYRAVSGKFAVERKDTGDVFGVVGSRYTPFQNVETFDFANALADQGGVFESAFQQRGGAVVGLTMRFPEQVLVGGEDACEKYLILRSKHDGSGCLVAGIQMKRMACLNAFNATLSAATNTVRIAHTRSLERQVEQAALLMDISTRAAEEFQRDAEQLMQLPMTDQDVDDLIAGVLSEIRLSDASLTKAADAINDNLRHSRTISDQHRKTGWGVLNAVGEYYDHLVDYRTGESELRSQLTGRAAHAKHAAQRLLLAH